MISRLLRTLVMLAAMSAMQAGATIWSATHSGTLDLADDGIGLFGGGDLTGAAYRVTYDYDPGQADFYYGGDDVSMGDTPNGHAVFRVILTVNGYTQISRLPYRSQYIQI